MENVIHLALAGNPNAGKTTLFNFLTGARQHVGNYPGITVEQKEGCCIHDDFGLSIVDLPGTYSLTAYSAEELVARDYLVNNNPDVVINVVDASNLERNLYLTSQFLELGTPLIIALNMVDVAESRGFVIDAEKLSELIGVPVVPIVARSGKGVNALLDQVVTMVRDKKQTEPILLRYGSDIDQVLTQITPVITEHGLLTSTYPARWVGVKLLENDKQIISIAQEEQPEITQQLLDQCEKVATHLKTTAGVYPESVVADHRYGFIKSILRQNVVTQKFVGDRLYTSDRIDKIVTHRFLGPLIMAAVLFGLYYFTFTFSGSLVGAFESTFAFLSSTANNLLPDGPIKSMVISGIIDGVGGVMGFVPIIMFMFFGIAILEDSGYLARVAFMMDRIFHTFGLHGSSVMPFIVSGGIAGGCAVPGVMATRTLRSPRERLATLLTVPFMNCGAKLPVLTLIIGAFFADHQAVYMFFATLLAWMVALCAAKFLRLTVLRGESTPFVMELPPYRFPTFRGLLIHTWERTWQYMKKAGTVILGISILLWAMMTYPSLPESQVAKFEQQHQEIATSYQKTDGEQSEQAYEMALQELQSQEAMTRLRHSLAGRIGLAMENLTQLAGIDWRTNIALLGGFAAKEVIISTLGTAYSLGEVDPEESTPLKVRLAEDPNWNPVVALAVLVFIMFYAPCFVTVVCIAKESGSWKWAFFSIGFNTTLAFLMAVGIFQLGTMLA
ncbi:ferrous iron transport protein B [Desulfogranum japonicum]|uniref:ferrous iron transport protein B n=1 Tax=Desulfogranum japonicum TaxID=231447 RepID=UPI00048B136D|nr:ferrous iron transport protein B [Desulfogranum japonicum]